MSFSTRKWQNLTTMSVTESKQRPEWIFCQEHSVSRIHGPNFNDCNSGWVDPGNKISGEWDWRKVILSFEEEMSTNILIGNVAVNLFPIYRSIPILFISSLWLIFQEKYVKIGFRKKFRKKCLVTLYHVNSSKIGHIIWLILHRFIWSVAVTSVCDGLSCALSLVSMECTIPKCALFPGTTTSLSPAFE